MIKRNNLQGMHVGGEGPHRAATGWGSRWQQQWDGVVAGRSGRRSPAPADLGGGGRKAAAAAPSPYLHPRRSSISSADAWTYGGTELQSLLAEEEWQDRIFTACAAMDSQMEHGGADAASTGESTGKEELNSEAVVLPTISATRWARAR